MNAHRVDFDEISEPVMGCAFTVANTLGVSRSIRREPWRSPTMNERDFVVFARIAFIHGRRRSVPGFTFLLGRRDRGSSHFGRTARIRHPPASPEYQ
jgi:hypothetical protein